LADLETPLPQARLNQQKGKFNALAVHDFGGNGVFAMDEFFHERCPD